MKKTAFLLVLALLYIINIKNKGGHTMKKTAFLLVLALLLQIL